MNHNVSPIVKNKQNSYCGGFAISLSKRTIKHWTPNNPTKRKHQMFRQDSLTKNANTLNYTGILVCWGKNEKWSELSEMARTMIKKCVLA